MLLEFLYAAIIGVSFSLVLMVVFHGRTWRILIPLGLFVACLILAVYKMSSN